MPPRQLRLHTLRLSALPFFRSLLDAIGSLVRRVSKTSSPVPDLNLIPGEYRGAPLMSRERLLLLLIIFELVLAVLLFRTYGEDSTDAVRDFLGMEVLSQEVRAENLRTVQITQARANLDNLSVAQREVGKQRANWPHLLDLIYNQPPADVTVSSFRQSESTVTLAGSAPTRQEVFGFQDLLNESPLIEEVAVPTLGAAGAGLEFTFKIVLRKGVNVE